MRVPTRLHVFFGVFIVLAAFVVGLVARPAISPFRQRAEIEMTGPHLVAGSGICRIQVTADRWTVTTLGFVTKSGEILSSRSALCPYFSHGGFLVWPNSYSFPDVLCGDSNPNLKDMTPVMALAFFPGCSQPIPLKVAGFSETSNVVIYRYNPNWVTVPPVSVALEPELRFEENYTACRDKEKVSGTPLVQIRTTVPKRHPSEGEPKTSSYPLDSFEPEKTEAFSLTYRLNNRYYQRDDQDSSRMEADSNLPEPTLFPPGTPVFNQRGEIVGLFVLGGGIAPLGEALKDVKPFSPAFEFRAVD